MESSCPCAHPCPGVGRNAPLLQGSSLITWRSGDTIWRRGDPSDCVLAVCTGALGLLGGDTLLDLVVRGELVGEEAAFGGRRSAGCVALVDGKARRLPRPQLVALLQRRAGGWRDLLGVSSERGARFAGRLAVAPGTPVAARLGAVLRDLAARAGLRDARGTMIPLRLPRRALADLVGCREETVVRALTALRRQGLLRTTREGLIVADVAALPGPDAPPGVPRS